MSDTIRLTTAEAIVRYLIAQRTEPHAELHGAVLGDATIDDARPDAGSGHARRDLVGAEPLVAGVFAIFGHGNVTCLGPALHDAGDALPTWRGQNEQGMALAAIGFAKAMRRRQFMAVTTSIGPGALNLVTAAGVAMANRLPVLMLVGDTFQSRFPDPVLQQLEHFDDPSITANDALRPVARYWDRITRPEQVITSLPHAIDTLLDPATCGPAVLALPQDVQAEAYDFPVELFEPAIRRVARPRPDRAEIAAAVTALRAAQRPLLVAGGGVHYSLAESELASFAERHGIPVVETVAGKSTLTADHPRYAGPIGVVGNTGANGLAAEADVVIAVGTRLGDFVTGSWSVFGGHPLTVVGVNAARFDAGKHRALPVVGDAAEALGALTAELGEWTAPPSWTERAGPAASELWSYLAELDRNGEGDEKGLPTYAQVVAAANRVTSPDDYALTASGGFPGELNNGWRSQAVATFDCEYGFSCMGYEISGGWGAAMARARLAPDGRVIVFVGDGSYLMLNSDLYSSVLSGHPMVVVLCDNGGFAVIDRLQRGQGGTPFNNMLADVRRAGGDLVQVDFAAHARALGCDATEVTTIPELERAVAVARTAERTTVIVIRTDPYEWTEGGAWWEVGVPEVSPHESIRAARRELEDAKAAQRRGV